MKKYFTKQTIVAFIIGAIVFSSVLSFAAVELNVVPNPFPVLIDGATATVDAYNINGFTYLKLADMRQTGLKVVFNETDSVIEIASQVTPTPIVTPDIPATTTNTPQATVAPAITSQSTVTPTPAPVAPTANYEGYNSACAALDSAMTVTNNALYQSWLEAYKTYPNDSVTKQVAYNAMQGNISINNTRLAESKQALKSQYNIP